MWPDFSAHYPFQVAPGYTPPQSPFISIDRNAGRLPRILQWSLGLQREVTRDLVVEASYVGNRGVWWTAPLLATSNYNSLTPAMITAAGLNPNNPSDLALLTTPISSPLVQARFPEFEDLTLPSGLQIVPSVYPGFPATQTLNQALAPRIRSGMAFLRSWVLRWATPGMIRSRLKVTKRYSHGLSANYAFSWQKELVLGTSNDTSYLVSAYPRINDVFNYAQNKELSPFSTPLVSIISFNYQTPKLPGDSATFKALSWVTKDWVIGALLRYQSGALMAVPASNNNYFNQTLRNQQPSHLGRWVDTPKPRSRTAAVRERSRSQLPLLRSHHATGTEPGGLGGYASGPVRQLGGFLQRLPLAASAGRVDEHGPTLPDRQGRSGQSEHPHRVPERVQSYVLFVSVGRIWVFPVWCKPHNAYVPHEPLPERPGRRAFERLWLRKLGERRRIPTAERADGGPVHVLTLIPS